MNTNAWIFLGMSLIRLGELPAAEDALAQANILDNLNPVVWGMKAALCLKYGTQRLIEAKYCFETAMENGL